MMDKFTQVRASAIDERAHNIFYRQTQIERLCKALIDNGDSIKDAIISDSDLGAAEAAIELALTVETVKRDYASFQPTKAHQEEYLVSAGKDAPFASKPFGMVYIEPTTHSFLYSSIVPLSAAITAGNCVILLLESTLRTVPSLLRQILEKALDRNTFAVTTARIENRELLDQALVVNQSGHDQYPRANELVSLANTRTVAIVDRTADIGVAAKELVAARFAFGGLSPYAPDIVLVNEFVKKQFLQALVSECVSWSDKAPGAKDANSGPTAGRVSQRVDKLKQADAKLRVVLQEERLAVVDLIQRNHEVLQTKVNDRVFVVHGVRSLDDAIDLIGHSSTAPALAAFHFANPASGKYLWHYVSAAVTFVNHVPRQILVGPAAPTTHRVHPTNRYPSSLFAVSRPAMIKPGTEYGFEQTAGTTWNRNIENHLIQRALTPLQVMRRSPGGSVGFFEQGFLMNASLILASTLSITGFGVYWAIKHGRSLW